jgi:hypothetical protein
MCCELSRSLSLCVSLSLFLSLRLSRTLSLSLFRTHLAQVSPSLSLTSLSHLSVTSLSLSLFVFLSSMMVLCGFAYTVAWSIACSSQAYDLVIDDRDNAETIEGFTRLLRQILRLRPGSLLWIAFPCSWFVYLSSSVHGRRRDKPYGNTGHPEVKRANNLACIVAGALRLAAHRHVRIALEQPMSSTLALLPCMARALCLINSTVHSTWLGAFGCPIPKPLHLYGNARFLGRLRRSQPVADAVQQALAYTRGVGHTVTGQPGLQQTQEYPQLFGEQVIAYYVASHPRIVQEIIAEAAAALLVDGAFPNDNSSDEDQEVVLRPQ